MTSGTILAFAYTDDAIQSLHWIGDKIIVGERDNRIQIFTSAATLVSDVQLPMNDASYWRFCDPTILAVTTNYTVVWDCQRAVIVGLDGVEQWSVPRDDQVYVSFATGT